MPWPKLSGGVEAEEQVDSITSAPQIARHHDGSLFLHDSVHLSPQWLMAYALLPMFYFAPASASGQASADNVVDHLAAGLRAGAG